MKSSLVKNMIFLGLLACTLIYSCEAEDSDEEKALVELSVSQAEQNPIAALSSSSSDAFILILDNTLKVQFSDGDKVVLIAEGEGEWQGQSVLYSDESRVLTTNGWTSEGEGRIVFPNIGSIYFVSDCDSYPIPNVMPLANWEMDITITGGDGAYTGASGQATYTIWQTTEFLTKEKAIIEGNLIY